MESIGAWCFWGCNNLTGIEVPEGVEVLEIGAFASCESLTEVILPSSIVELKRNTFYQSPEMQRVIYRGTRTKWNNVKLNTGDSPSIPDGLDVCYSVSAYDISGAFDGIIFNNKAQKPPVIVRDGDEILQEGVDYTVSYANNTNAGKAKVIVKGIGEYAEQKEQTFRILPKKITPTVALSTTTYVYNGKVRKPAVTVKSGSTKLAASNYTVTYASGRKNPGTYKVTVKLKGNYSGTKSVSFKINPKPTTLSTLKPGSKKMTVKWKKQAVQTTGYQIQYATDSKFTKNKKIVTVKGAAKTGKTITGLRGGRKYYVRIRTYKTVSGKNYYSTWSRSKATTVKK